MKDELLELWAAVSCRSSVAPILLISDALLLFSFVEVVSPPAGRCDVEALLLVWPRDGGAGPGMEDSLPRLSAWPDLDERLLWMTGTGLKS